MAKTQYYTATTIDGFIADENNSLDWLFEVGSGEENETAEPGDSRFGPFLAQVGAMAMGATTYEWVVDHDDLLDNPARWQRSYADVPCWVFTHRDLPAVPGANLTFVQGDVGRVHEAMTHAAGDRNIWLVGGGDLVGQFADRGLLHEILLAVAPVSLGRGAPLLPRRLTSSRLELTDVERTGQLARLTYRVR
jgi:dihydrofolate reductase